MVKIDKPVPENYPAVFEVFDYMFLGFVVLGLVAVSYTHLRAHET